MTKTLPQLEAEFDKAANLYKSSLDILALAQNAVTKVTPDTPDADDLYTALQDAMGNATVARSRVELAKMSIEVATLCHGK